MAVRRVSRRLARDFVEIRQLQLSVKGSRGFAQRARDSAEREIVGELHEAKPNYGLICPQAEAIAGADPTRSWAINVLDGFENFSRGVPRWGMSVTLLQKGQPVMSLIHDVTENEMFISVPGEGSWMNDTRIRASNKSRLSDFLAVTDEATLNRGISRDFSGPLKSARVMGAVSLDLANLSCGRLDGFWSEAVNLGDLPAAELLLSEAGGLIESISESGIVAAGNEGFGEFSAHVRRNSS